MACPGESRRFHTTLSRNLPEFLSALRVRTPAIRVLFDIFIREHRDLRPSSRIEIEHIFDEEAIDGQGREEDLIYPGDLCTYPPKPSYLVRVRGVEPPWHGFEALLHPIAANLRQTPRLPHRC
jgi:hypothetical protein